MFRDAEQQFDALLTLDDIDAESQEQEPSEELSNQESNDPNFGNIDQWIQNNQENDALSILQETLNNPLEEKLLRSLKNAPPLEHPINDPNQANQPLHPNVTQRQRKARTDPPPSSFKKQPMTPIRPFKPSHVQFLPTGKSPAISTIT